VEAILDVAKGGELLVVSEDGGVTKALEKKKNVEVFKSLSDLLDSHYFADESEIESTNVESLLTFTKKSVGFEFFKKTFGETLVAAVGGRTVSHYDSWNDQTEELFISTAGPVVEWNIDFDSHEYLGEGVISLPFDALLEVNVDTSTGDYSHDLTYGTSEDAFVKISGWMSIIVEDPSMLRIPFEWTTEKLKAAISVSVDEIDSTTLKDFEPGSTKYYTEMGEDDE
jgi:hypothetical protein